MSTARTSCSAIGWSALLWSVILLSNWSLTAAAPSASDKGCPSSGYRPVVRSLELCLHLRVPANRSCSQRSYGHGALTQVAFPIEVINSRERDLGSRARPERTSKITACLTRTLAPLHCLTLLSCSRPVLSCGLVQTSRQKLAPGPAQDAAGPARHTVHRGSHTIV